MYDTPFDVIIIINRRIDRNNRRMSKREGPKPSPCASNQSNINHQRQEFNPFKRTFSFWRDKNTKSHMFFFLYRFNEKKKWYSKWNNGLGFTWTASSSNIGVLNAYNFASLCVFHFSRVANGAHTINQLTQSKNSIFRTLNYHYCIKHTYHNIFIAIELAFHRWRPINQQPDWIKLSSFISNREIRWQSTSYLIHKYQDNIWAYAWC